MKLRIYLAAISVLVDRNFAASGPKWVFGADVCPFFVVIVAEGEQASEMVVHPDGVSRPRQTAAFKRMQMDAWRKVNASLNEKAKNAGFKKAWSHKMSLVVTRPPILAPLPEEWEVKYNEWRERYDAPINAQIPSIQPLLDEDPAKKSDASGTNVKLTEADLANMDEEQKQRALRAEEIAAAAREEAVVKVGERITKADKENDRKSLRRKLDEQLYFIVKKNRADHSWQFPQVPLPVDVTNETKQLRDFASDGANAVGGASAQLYMVGNAPAGVYSYPFSSTNQKSLDTYGAKLFFYRGYYIQGDISRPSRYVDHAWVTKSELKEYIQDPELYNYLGGILI